MTNTNRADELLAELARLLANRANKKAAPSEGGGECARGANPLEQETLGEWQHVGDLALRAALKLRPWLLGAGQIGPDIGVVGPQLAPSDGPAAQPLDSQAQGRADG